MKCMVVRVHGMSGECWGGVTGGGSACVQLSRCGLAIRAMPTQLLREKLRSVRRRTRSVFETVFRP